MKESIKKFHNQNNGSTLIIVLTVVAFLSVLAVIVTSAAAMNYKMKLINKQSQKVFYTSEDAVDEIYAALGQITMTAFNDAYTEEMSNVVKHTNIGGNDVTYTMSGMASNRNMRLKFAYNLVTALNLWNGSTPSDETKTEEYSLINYNAINDADNLKRGEFVELLNSFLEEKEGLRVVSVGSIVMHTGKSEIEKTDLDTYTVTFTDCVVEYINENEYYSKLAFDCNLTMPDIYIEFATDSKSGLDAFKDYALIGNTGIVLNDSADMKLTGSAYAGKLKGLYVGTGASFKSSGDDVNIIVGGDIDVNDGTFTAGNSSIWCTGIVVSGESGSDVSINSNTYVKDDLQIDGDGSNVTVKGNYYGYSWAGLNVKEGNHNNSSAIIVNGRNATLNLSGINELLISGNAYIDYRNGTSSYATGESLSLKGSQEIYLVPSYLMSKSNPVVGDTSDVTVNISAGNFFGYRYLDIPSYTARTIGGVTYYYLNFKDDESAAAYVRALLDDDVYETEVIDTLDASDSGTRLEYDKSRQYIKKVIETNLTALGSITGITVNDGANITANSNLLKAEKKNSIIDSSIATGSQDSETDFAKEAKDMANRYSAWTTILSEPDANYRLADYAENNVFANIVSVEKFNKLVENGVYAKAVPGTNVILYAINNSKPLVIDDKGDFKHYSEGIIVASGDIIIKKDFSGTIIAGGKITIEGTDIDISNAITNSSVRDILAKGYSEDKVKEVEDFVDIFEGSTGITDNSGLSLSELTYKNFIEFINWRKSYEES